MNSLSSIHLPHIVYARRVDGVLPGVTRRKRLFAYGQNMSASRPGRSPPKGCRYHERSTMCDRFHWARLLAFVTGLVNQELLLRNEYLIAENRILRSKLPNRLPLSDPDRAVLGEIAKRLGRRALRDIARVARPDTVLGWYRRLVAQKFDGSRHRSYPGRPRVSAELEAFVVRFARENRSWGYDRIAGALANLGHAISDQTVGNILRRYKIPPAPERSRTTTWKEFIRSHMDVLAVRRREDHRVDRRIGQDLVEADGVARFRARRKIPRRWRACGYARR